MQYAKWIIRPINMLLAIGIIIFSIEMLVMLALLHVHLELSVLTESLIDAAILTLFSAIFIFFFIVRPIANRLTQDNRQLHEALLATKVNAEVMKTTAVGILITDPDSNIVSVNPGFTRLTGLSAQEVIGAKPSVLHSGRQDPHFYQTMWRSIKQTGGWEGDLCNVRRDGTEYLEHLSIKAVRDDAGRVQNYVGVFQDITLEKALKKKLMRQARFDKLTKIHNRAAFDDCLTDYLLQARQDERSVLVFFMDVDKFKQINDQYGHDTGDKILIHIAHCFKRSLRENDLKGRYGGDEFVVAVSCDTEQVNKVASSIANTLIMAIKGPVTVNKKEFFLEVSIGVSVYPADAQNQKKLVKMADEAMYKAKRDDHSSYAFWRELN